MSILLGINQISHLYAQGEIEEALLENQHEEASELLEHLLNLRQHPADLNRISLRTLLTYPFLSPFMVRNLIRDRSVNGPFQSWSDFQKRLDIQEYQLRVLRDYFTISLSHLTQGDPLQFRWHHQIPFKDLENSRYIGSPWKAYQRLTFDSGSHWRMGLLTEKDTGESRWNDHLVGYVEGRNLFHGSRLLVGNFRVETGQGLVLWGPYGLFKGADPASPLKKRPRGILGHSSTEETLYLSGIASEIHARSFRITAFVSSRSLDATLNEDGSVKHIRTTGLHRTVSEMAAMNRLHETLTGGRIEHTWNWGTVGMTGWKAQYSKNIDPNDPVRYYYDFRGDKNHVVGIDADLYLWRINLFSEVARSRSEGWAFIGNSIIDMGRSLLVFSYRHFDPFFQNSRSHSFCTSDVSNEEGFYWGFRYTFSKQTRLSFYYDAYRRPWRTYSIPVPVRGDDLFIQVDQAWSSTVDLTLRARFNRRETMHEGFLNEDLTTSFLRDRQGRVSRIELRYRPMSVLSLKSRFETVALYYPESRGIVSHPATRESGFLFYQDIGFRPQSSVNISVRWIFFDTDSYDSRVYEFEGDVPGVLSIRPLYGKGHRGYIIFRWKIAKNLRFCLKGAVTFNNKAESWHSENYSASNNTHKQINIQFDFGS